MIDRDHALSVTKQAEAAGPGAEHGVLPAAPCAGDRIRPHAPDRQAAFGVSLCGVADVAPSFGCQWEQGRPRHVKTLMGAWAFRHSTGARARPSRSRDTRSIPICYAAWRSCGRTRSGRWTSPISRWRKALSISPRCSTGSRGACCGGVFHHDGGLVLCRGIGRHFGRRWRPEIVNTDQGSQFTGTDFTGMLIESRSRSAWTARAPGGTMCSSNGFGGR